LARAAQLAQARILSRGNWESHKEQAIHLVDYDKVRLGGGFAVRKWAIRILGGMLVMVLSVIPQDARTELDHPLMRVYFIPFDVLTYVGITMDSVENASTYAIWFMKGRPPAREEEHIFISKLRRHLESRPAPGKKIADNFIRLKVDFGEQTFFVDQKGTIVEKDSGKTFTLSKAQMRQIENDILYFAGVVDLRASRNVQLPK
jgi:hypothetical protein